MLFKKHPRRIHRFRGKSLGLLELVAIALGGMVGGGIFTVLGLSVSKVGAFTPFAIFLGGLIALVASYSYVKLGVYFKDEGASYSFFKKAFPRSPFAAALIGWWVIFGYISTIALYSYTFSSYAISGFEFAKNEVFRKAIAIGITLVFTVVNVLSVKGMGKLEDIMVYSKLVILVTISVLLAVYGQENYLELIEQSADSSLLDILIVSSLTFVAYEGFQLVINAVNEMEDPEKNIPRAIYSAIGLAITIYVVIAIGAILAIPFEDLIKNKESALASGANAIIGVWGSRLVVLGALLATSSAISGTVFGASRQMSVIAFDGYFPDFLSARKNGQPVRAIITMSVLSIFLVTFGNLELFLEFGSITFLLVSLLMAVSNFKLREQTNSSLIIIIFTFLVLLGGTSLILYYEATTQIEQLYFIIGIYLLLTLAAFVYSKVKKTAIKGT